LINAGNPIIKTNVMNTSNNKAKDNKQQEHQNNFIEGDNVVPQGGEINKTNKQDKEKPNPPSNPPQKIEKKIPSLRSNS
jgi:hypothetical protein